jgi:cytochrome c peroxidase
MLVDRLTATRERILTMRSFAALPLLVAALSVAGAAATAQDTADLVQPEGWSLPQGDRAALVDRGAELFDDPSIGETGSACSTCHDDFANYNETFREPYPHFVAMGKDMFDMDEVTAAEMVQLCMVVPMGAAPLPWDSGELAALAAYVEDERERFAAR